MLTSWKASLRCSIGSQRAGGSLANALYAQRETGDQGRGRDEGAGGMVRDTLCPSRSLVNGAPGCIHSRLRSS